MVSTYTKKIPDTFANRIRMIRHEEGLTTREFAILLGVSHGTVNLWEHGSSPSNLDVIAMKLANEFGYDPAWIAFGEYAPRDLNPEPADYEFVKQLQLGLGEEDFFSLQEAI